MTETKLEKKRRSGRERVRAFRDRQKAKEAASFSNFWSENKQKYQQDNPYSYKKLVERHNEIEALENLVEQVVNDPDTSRVAGVYAAVMRRVEKAGSLNYEAVAKEFEEATLSGNVTEALNWDFEKEYFGWFGFRLSISEEAVAAIRERYEQIKQPQAEPQAEPQPISIEAIVQPPVSADEGKKEDVGLL